MASYLQLDIEKIIEIMPEYGLDLKRFESIKGGACNSSFLLHTKQGKYILTVFEDHDMEYISNYCHILIHLKKNHFQTSDLIIMENGNYVSELFGKPMILKTYLEGEVHKNLDEEMLKQIGTKLAKLHNLPTTKKIPTKYPHGVQEFHKVIGNDIDPFYESWLIDQIDFINDEIDQELPRSLIHGDLFFDNILFLDGQLSVFIDFVESCNYFKIFDLGMAVVGQCMQNEEISYKKVKALLSGYESIRELEDREKDAFQFFIEYAVVVISFWRYKRYNVHKIVEEKKQDHTEMAKNSRLIRSIPRSEFKKSVF